MDIITLESCHSTWILSPRHLRFCRILKGIAVGQRPISTEWRPYWDLEIDQPGGTLTLFLNEARTRLIRSSIHTEHCAQCSSFRTTEISLEEIHRAVA
jgi:hypothetical protein